MEIVIDLHLDDTKEGFDPRNALLEQMDQFEKALDTALARNFLQIRVIHGIGSGKLKSEIFKYIKGIKYIHSYSCEWHPKYGMGSTLIVFKL